MKKILSLIVALLIGISSSACALLGDPVAEKVAEAIDRYCEEPLGARELYRATINAELADEGHSLVVTCAGDPDPEVTSTSIDVSPGAEVTSASSLASPGRQPVFSHTKARGRPPFVAPGAAEAADFSFAGKSRANDDTG